MDPAVKFGGWGGGQKARRTLEKYALKFNRSVHSKFEAFFVINLSNQKLDFNSLFKFINKTIVYLYGYSKV